MFRYGDEDRDALLRPCLEEALACQDLLARSPREPALRERLLAPLVAAFANLRPTRWRGQGRAPSRIGGGGRDPVAGPIGIAGAESGAPFVVPIDASGPAI